MSRHRFVTQQYAAEFLGVTVRTVRNKISEGVLTSYRLPGLRAVRVDLEEIESKFEPIPTAKRRAGRVPFGPKAKIIEIEDEDETETLGTMADSAGPKRLPHQGGR